MPNYVLTLKLKNDSESRGNRNGTTFQVTPHTVGKDVVTVWTFNTSDGQATVTTALEVAVAARAAVAFIQ